MPKYYGSGLIGLDAKPRRKTVRNRFVSHSRNFIIPLILVLVTLGFFILAVSR